MAHVLLPCDVPNWPELQRQLSQLRMASSVDQLVTDVQKVHDACCVNLDPDEIPKGDALRFEGLRWFLSRWMNEDERGHFFRVLLSALVTQALRLRYLKPVLPIFQYSLQMEDGVTVLEKRFVASLLANALFSTFVRRTQKTHPTLQDFSFGEFFRHLQKPTQQEKWRYILKYFQKVSVSEPRGTIRICRQVLPGKCSLSLPEWLCSSRLLCPLVVRTYGHIEDAEPQMIKESMFFCRVPELLSTLCFVEALMDREALIVEGATVLAKPGDHSMNLMDCDAETDVLLMDAMDFSSSPRRQYEDSSLLRELSKLLAAFQMPHSRKPAERPSPVGGESSSAGSSPSLRSRGSPATGTTGESSSQGSSRRSSSEEWQKSAIYDDFWKDDGYRSRDSPSTLNRPTSPSSTTKTRSNSAQFAAATTRMTQLVSSLQTAKTSQQSSSSHATTEPSTPKAKVSKSFIVQPVDQTQAPPTLPPPTSQKNQGSQQLPATHHRTKKQDSREKMPPLPGTCTSKRKSASVRNGAIHKTSCTTSKLPPVRASSASGNSASLRRQSSGKSKAFSKGRLLSQPSGEEEYFTADESMDECEEMWYLPGLGLTTAAKLQQLPMYPLQTPRSPGNPKAPPLLQDKSMGSSTRSDSVGYCLGDGSDDEMNLSLHERYEDFRKRIRRRSRGLSRRHSSSRHSRHSSSGSSEMEDIDEDPELGFGGSSTCTVIRSANSEPLLFQPTSQSEQALISPILSVPPEAILLAKRGRKLVMTTSDGQLKAYSYDGVHPNLPVPFKARFRRRRSCSEGDDSSVRLVNLEDGGGAFYSMANKTFWQKVEEGARSGVTSPASSSQDDLSNPEDGDEDEEEPPPGERMDRRRGERPATPPTDRDLYEDDEEERYYHLLQPSPEGLRPVATGRWGCGRQRGDPQLKAVLQWLAASVAGLPCLVFYTKGDPCLDKMERLGQLVEAKQWAVGDLACETLRYCRNRLSLQYHGATGAKTPVPEAPPFLFTILLGDSLLAQHDSLD